MMEQFNTPSYILHSLNEFFTSRIRNCIHSHILTVLTELTTILNVLIEVYLVHLIINLPKKRLLLYIS